MTSGEGLVEGPCWPPSWGTETLGGEGQPPWGNHTCALPVSACEKWGQVCLDCGLVTENRRRVTEEQTADPLLRTVSSGLSHPRSLGPLQPPMALNAAQRKTVNFLKT